MDIAPDLASVALAALLLAAAALFVSNNYIGKRWYYYSSLSKNTVYESHLENIDNIGCIVFFVTLISGLTFLITAVFILNIFKSIAVGTLISERPYRDLQIGFWIYDKCRGLYVIGRLGRFFCPKFHR